MTESLPFSNNGDIIILLPLMKRWREKRGIAPRMVVTPECKPLLEGVSYAQAVDPETPQVHGAVSARVFVRGMIPTNQPQNYAERSWYLLGAKWDAAAPLEFNRRNYEREMALASSVFKTKKRKLLVKLDGKSSPFDRTIQWRERIAERLADKLEVVWLDDIRAERLYDLLGLMDRAAGLLTVDTATLWLAHASTVPNIALVHPNDHRSSPARGNCVLRATYTEAEREWPKIEQTILGLKARR